MSSVLRHVNASVVVRLLIMCGVNDLGTVCVLHPTKIRVGVCPS